MEEEEWQGDGAEMKIEIYVYTEKKTEKFYKKAMEEYKKRLGRYVTIDDKFIRKEKDWRKVCQSGAEGYYLSEGNSLTSEKFSRFLEKAEITGTKKLCFFISESQWYEENKNWICQNISNRFSLSEFTMSAPMQALILFEQIYRGYRIIHNHPYHK